PAGVVHRHEIYRNIMGTGVDEHLGRISGVLGGTATPRAAVNEDTDRRVPPCGFIDIKLLDFRRTIGNPVGLNAGAYRFAPRSAPLADVGLVRRPDALVIGVIQ